MNGMERNEGPRSRETGGIEGVTDGFYDCAHSMIRRSMGYRTGEKKSIPGYLSSLSLLRNSVCFFFFVRMIPALRRA
jgi:hypothetical protein